MLDDASKKKLLDIIKKAETYKKEKYSIENMRAMLGAEPWDSALVLNLYMRNFINMTELLHDHSGYKVYISLLEFFSLFRHSEDIYKSIMIKRDDCLKDYFSQDITNATEKHNQLIDTQEVINLMFFQYASTSFAIIESESRLQEKFAIDKEKISNIFDNILNNGCHRAIIFLRHKLNHGKRIKISHRCSIDWRKDSHNIDFIFDREAIVSIKLEGSNDKKAVEYLLSNSTSVIKLLDEHIKMLKKFCIEIYSTIFDEHKNSILQCNDLCKAIIKMQETQFHAIAKSIGKEFPVRAIDETETYYIERMIGGRA